MPGPLCVWFLSPFPQPGRESFVELPRFGSFVGCDGSAGGGADAWTVGVACVGAGGDVTGAGGGVGDGAGFGFGCGFGFGGDGCGVEVSGAGADRTGVTATGCEASKVEADVTRWECGAT